ncbi:hypothetical protein M2105_001679 [Paenibacillus sp. PastF-1]|nr:hypothetical protein [Paenibacillus sp. PastF-2]MDF9847263.1 hypothetical protein [Paenibacillus sp. PastM-2]MDF9853834.1 hypothetical protein [Paenibacillus sp. PastF-1]MDH6478680.1 hypothetical protein [Paenibacillus sp. PastH-2]MDH6506412.1 hypothetical protein [Paenibacillus sp. PastM-3]
MIKSNLYTRYLVCQSYLWQLAVSLIDTMLIHFAFYIIRRGYL